ncbi:hypothetical protein [Bombiscardovia coagulans]|uniref:ABC transporter permease n=1 Tax=Bombiscardovia coagulans TaxID=686666 RepID=A0A261ETQ1_9BIFI|nr:hypothetical protein [Bombiscardovia coagulans]OZG50252.1 ABC transporter permease [Bombiscardovia coagulans]
MNWPLLRRKLISNVLSLRMAVIVVVAVLLIGLQYWTTVHAGYVIADSAPTFLRGVMLYSIDGTGTALYLFILPFLAALLGGSVLAVERHSGRLQNVLVREGRSATLNTLTVASFLLGGFGGVLPLLLNLLLSALKTPNLSFIDGEAAVKSLSTDHFMLIDPESWLYPLYKQNQVLFIIVSVLLVFSVSAALSVIAMSASLFTRYRYVELFVPFLLSLLVWVVPALTNWVIPEQWSHNLYLHFALGTGDSGPRNQNIVGFVMTLLGAGLIAVTARLIDRSRDVL